MTPQHKNMAYTLGVIAFLVMLALWVSDADAHGYHGGDTTNNYYSQSEGDTTVKYTGMDSEEFDKGMAMSAAGDTCVFDYAPGWQGCGGAGWYSGESALNGSLVTRVDNFAVRLNLQTDIDFDEQAVGAGFSWHF